MPAGGWGAWTKYMCSRIICVVIVLLIATAQALVATMTAVSILWVKLFQWIGVGWWAFKFLQNFVPAISFREDNANDFAWHSSQVYLSILWMFTFLSDTMLNHCLDQSQWLSAATVLLCPSAMSCPPDGLCCNTSSLCKAMHTAIWVYHKSIVSSSEPWTQWQVNLYFFFVLFFSSLKKFFLQSLQWLYKTWSLLTLPDAIHDTSQDQPIRIWHSWATQHMTDQ